LLIDSYPLENAVLRSGIPERMLTGLNQLHVAGLEVLGDELGVSVSTRRPLLAPADWRAGSASVAISRWSRKLAIRALGATARPSGSKLSAATTGLCEAIGHDLNRQLITSPGQLAEERVLADGGDVQAVDGRCSRRPGASE